MDRDYRNGGRDYSKDWEMEGELRKFYKQTDDDLRHAERIETVTAILFVVGVIGCAWLVLHAGYSFSTFFRFAQ